MTRIEYDNYVIAVPDGWDEITVSRYESFCYDKPEDARGRVAYVSKVTGVSEAQLLAWPGDVFAAIVDALGWLWQDNPAEPSPDIVIGGTRYRVCAEEALSFGAYIDLEAAQKSGEEVISKVLAIVCRPLGEAYDTDKVPARKAMFAALPMSAVLGVMAFFLRRKSACDATTLLSLTVHDEARRLAQSIEALPRPGVGIRYLTSWRGATSYVTMRLLRNRLRQFLRASSTTPTATRRRGHNKNLTKL
jgi:hypothetical protein